jgi:hypothetical protein
MDQYERQQLGECDMNFLKRGMLISLSTAMVAVLLLLLRASPASAANNCLQDVASKHLVCTANDVSIAEAVNPRDLSGKSISTCFQGTRFSFLVDFNVVTTATARENIGLYLGTTPGGSALTGTCSDSIISPYHAPLAAGPPGGTEANCVQNGGPDVCLGTPLALYHEFDTSLTGDNCGDTTSADGTKQFVTVELDNVLCPVVGSTFALPNCTSWQQPGGAILCDTNEAGGWPWVPAATPGSPSKCNCSTVSIPITPIAGNISVLKDCAAPGTTTYAKTCSAPEPGGAFNYQVVVTNKNNFGSDTIHQVCDDKFGTIATDGTFAACPAGTVGSATVGSCTVPTTLANPGDTMTCTFSGGFTGSEGSLTDKVTANGKDQGGGLVTSSDTATASITEVSASSSVSKSLDSGHACATVRYKVEVDNTSGATTDETLSLGSLLDSAYGDITTVQGNVLGTTCGVATTSAGSGTLSKSFGAGTIPATIAVGGKYVCEFDGQFCAALGPFGTCATGLEQKDTVTASLTGDETGQTITGPNSASLTVDTCFTTTTP